ncbi:MAG: hypothetical protein LBQ96_00935 [Fusobacteriaceae bacterium]|jgi:putative chitinase|nr:hypothetical protein [Fusobacteriaceae bacterium]
MKGYARLAGFTLSLLMLSACGSLKKNTSENEMISRYFTFGEAIHSDYAIKHHILNYPRKSSHRNNILRTAKRMDEIRELLGRPIVITSWYRSAKINDAVGGSDSSEHREGLAVDFYLDKTNPAAEFNRIAKSGLSFDQLIFYTGGHRAHIGFRKNKRRERREVRRVSGR